MLIHDDCRHFLGDRPCRPHKQSGVHCDACPHYEPLGSRILVIKLDALGDVLRTTCILDALHAAHPGARLEWLTCENATPLFDNNPLVHRVHAFPGCAWLPLLAGRYDLVVNLDSSPVSAQLASMARTQKLVGFRWNADGHVEPANAAAREWFEMGLFDDIKLANRKTYQQIALEICGLPTSHRPLHLHLGDHERGWAREQGARMGILAGVPVVGLNTGASARWPHKKWTEEGYVELVRRMASMDAGKPFVLLFGGNDERERNDRIVAATDGACINTGTSHDLRKFFALLDLCDVVVTGDTLALHAAAALGKRVVALFGPTSSAEIDLYGRGRKLVSDAPCVGRYLSTCEVQPTCMERISAAEVHAVVRELLEDRDHAA